MYDSIDIIARYSMPSKSQIINGRKAFVELKFGPNWSYISTVRNFIINFLAITLVDKKRADHIAMAVNELVENAIKYSDRDGIDINLEVFRNKKDDTIKVMVCNHAKKNEVETLKKILTEINSEPPLEAFMKRMKDSAIAECKKSNIGLARVRYESNAKISADYENGFVKVFAEFDEK